MPMDKGAHFQCCDFQVHTPRDRQWQGDCPSTNEERKSYASEFIAACHDKGLTAVAITDHHDMAFIPYIRQAAQTEVDTDGNPLPPDQQITVFPGMELTLGIPCQALLIFDANFPDDMFTLAVTALAINPADSLDVQCKEIQRLEIIRGLDILYETLNKYEYLKGRYIVLPNVSEGGKSTLLRAGYAGHYKNMPCVGGYLDGPVTQLGAGNTTILQGRNNEYGRKALGLFQTSDNRSRDFRDLGVVKTWVKWAEPTAEALRQACLARESRISQTAPLTPNISVLSLSVSNSSFLGPISLEFNNQYNAIIGGRGTGKSTILEYLRWALCDESSYSADYEDLPDYHAKRSNLVKQTLTQLNANVQVNFIINGVPHSVRRDSKSDMLTLKIGNGNYELCTESDIKNLLPIQAYSQKQLSNVGVRLDELTRFVQAPIKQQLEDLNQRITKTALEIRKAYTRLQEKRALKKTLNNDETEKRSLSERVSSIKKQLTGISEEDRLILSQYDDYLEEDRIAQSYSQQIADLTESLNALKQIVANPPTVDLDSLPNASTMKPIQQQLTFLFKRLVQHIDQSITLLRNTAKEDDPFHIALKNLKTKHDEFIKAYEAALAKSTAHEATLKQLTDLEQRLKTIRQRSTSNKAAIHAAGVPEEEFAKLRNEWCILHDNRTQLFESQCTIMTQLSAGQIRATLKKGANVDKVAEGLKSAIYGSAVRGSKVDTLCDTITNDINPVRKYQAVLDELEALAIRDLDNQIAGERQQTPTLIASGFTVADLDKISGKLTPDSWLDLCTIPLDDNPVFEYRTRENEYIPFHVASAGQQATALLTVLLNQSGVPLIIDQPEDDLDNKVIPDIVKQIWKAKQTRQLIFTSHNANLVVNGDAELVVCCDYRIAGEQSSGHIKYEGAIDVENVRNEITVVMEGGAEAFTLRKQKYGF